MKDLRNMIFLRRRDGAFSFHPFISDFELKMKGFLGQEKKDIFNLAGIMLVDPFSEETVRHFHLNLVTIHREELNGFDPDIEILRANPLL